MKEKIKKFMEEPLTVKRELQMSAVVCGIFMIPYVIVAIVNLYRANKAISEMDDKQEARLKKMMNE